MIAIIFEVWPADGETAHYLDLAAQMKSEVVKIDGFISVERFQSLTEPGKLLSISFWRDEAAVTAWRNLPAHRRTQSKGRNGIFSDYRLKVLSVIRDYGMHDRAEAPADSITTHTSLLLD
jgi:heme-degrading monooxygenase HmoA